MGLNVTPQGSFESAGQEACQGATRLWDPARLLSVQAAWGLHLDWGPHACVQLGQGPPSGVRIAGLPCRIHPQREWIEGRTRPLYSLVLVVPASRSEPHACGVRVSPTFHM